MMAAVFARAGGHGIGRRGLTLTVLVLALYALMLLVATTVHAAESPDAVRIGVISRFRGGEPVYSGHARRIIEEGLLQRQLAQRGVDLQWVPIAETNVATQVNEAFAAGQIDFAAYGDLPAIILNAGGVRTRIVVPSGRGSDSYLVVPPTSTATSIGDLRGKRIALHKGRPWELPFARLLGENGLSYRDFRIFNVNPQAGAAALAAGDVDAVFTTSGNLLASRGIGRILWSTKGAPLDWKYRAELWGATKFLQQYPFITQLVANAYVSAAHWASLDANRDEVIRRRALEQGIDEALVRRELDDPSLPWSQRWSPLLDSLVYHHYRHTLDFAFDRKLIRRRLDASELIEPSFVNQALRTLGLESFWAIGIADRGSGS